MSSGLIHRGATEIGGNCIEVEVSGKSILLDLGAPLMGSITKTSDLVLAAFSGQNIDRFVTFYKATKIAHRNFVVDLYIAHLLRALGRKSLTYVKSGLMGLKKPCTRRSSAN